MPMTLTRGALARRGGLVAFLALLLLAAGLPVHAARPAQEDRGTDGWGSERIAKSVLPARDRQLARDLPGRARVAYHPATRRVRLLSGTPSAPLSNALPAVAGGRHRLSAADATATARSFLERYGRHFGLDDPARELRAMDDRTRLSVPVTTRGTVERTSSTVRFQQVRRGVPVMGGEIVVQLTEQGEVLSAAGEALPSGVRASLRPRLGLKPAQRIAALWLARESGRPPTAVRTTSEGLAIYDPRIMGGPALGRPAPRLVWQIDARTAGNGKGDDEHRLVLVDARRGEVVTSIAREARIDRRVCDARNVPRREYRCEAPFTRIEGQPATGREDVDSAYRLMGVVDDYFRARFGRDGIDDNGARMKATVRYCPGFGCPFNNAEWHWADQQTVFGRGWAQADDIVGHELTHGVLDHEARFFYHYQSGALNESFADIFGELIDQADPGGRDSSWARWKIGEDTPIGAFRDMRDPTRYGDPDSVRSPLWYAGSSDDGGVHRNDGVGNKAAYLIAAGGSFRGHTIVGLGSTRMGRIFYRAMASRLTSAADYVDLADALLGACTDLAGSSGITVAACASVEAATRATQMHLTPIEHPPRTAPLCGSGKRPVDVFFDDLEDPGSGNWKQQRIVGRHRGWYYPPNPNNDPTWDATWASSGELNLYGLDRAQRSDTLMRLATPVLLPKRAYLRFEHGFAFDSGRKRYDGGIVEISIDGGPWRGTQELFTHGGYNGRLAKGTGNPLGGDHAFTGDSRGWGSSRLDLAAFAGHMFRVRFRVGTDRSGGGLGWYLDDVRVYVCTTDSDAPTGTLTIDGGAVSTSDPDVQLTLTATDATTWVTTLRLSNSDSMEGNKLAKALSLPFEESVAWDLSASEYGGSAAAGTKTVYAQVRDAAGNWSDVFSATIELQPGP